MLPIIMKRKNSNMPKELNEMTIEELWELFPIILTKPNRNWSKQFSLEKELLKTKLASFKIKLISHVGSTAIPNIWAKPIVDILIEIDQEEDMNSVAQAIISSGYIKMSESPNRISFNKGYTKFGFAEQVFHLHLRYSDDNDELYFRDYLIAHPDVAKQYEQFKLSLWHEYEHDRDGYTKAKTDFIQNILKWLKCRKYMRVYEARDEFK